MPPRHFEVADEEAEPITFAFRGEVYRCRGDAPALPLLRGLKARLNGGLEAEVSDAVILEMLEALFEPGELDRLLRTGIGFGPLGGIARKLMAIHQGRDIAEEADEGEAMPPDPGATTSSASSSNAST